MDHPCKMDAVGSSPTVSSVKKKYDAVAKWQGVGLQNCQDVGSNPTRIFLKKYQILIRI